MLCVLPPQTRTGQIRNVAWIADMSGYNFLFLFGKQVSIKQTPGLLLCGLDSSFTGLWSRICQ